MTKKLVPPSLHPVATCANCKHVFIRREFDEEDQLYCQKIQKRPKPCCSVLMGEWEPSTGFDVPWETYATNAEVQANTICHEYEPVPSEEAPK